MTFQIIQEMHRNFCVLRMRTALLALCCLVATSFLVSAQADYDGPTGKKLYQGCKALADRSSGDAFDKGLCAGIITGVSEAVLYKNIPEQLKLCAPEGVTGSQMAHVVLKWLDAHPEKLNMPLSTLVWLALNEAWPCTN
ncbi:Rap1a/Tai family immunity protein [Labrys neptuniae]